METGSTRVYVAPRAGGGWELRETAGGPALARPTSRPEALARARRMLESGRGGEVLVLGTDGSVLRTVPVQPAGPRPWWYVRPGLSRWLLPVLVGLQLVLRLVAMREGAGTLDLVLTVGLLVLFLLLLLIVVRSRSADRARWSDDGA